MYITFNPRTMAPVGATPAKPTDDSYVEIEKQEWMKFLLDPSLFSQYEVVLQSEGNYKLCKIVDKSFSLKNRFFEITRSEERLVDADVCLYLNPTSALLTVPTDVEKRFSSMTFFVCKKNDPDMLYETLHFVGGKREVGTDLLERLDIRHISVFGSFKYNELTYKYWVSDDETSSTSPTVPNPEALCR